MINIEFENGMIIIGMCDITMRVNTEDLRYESRKALREAVESMCDVDEIESI